MKRKQRMRPLVKYKKHYGVLKWEEYDKFGFFLREFTGPYGRFFVFLDESYRHYKYTERFEEVVDKQTGQKLKVRVLVEQ